MPLTLPALLVLSVTLMSVKSQPRVRREAAGRVVEGSKDRRTGKSEWREKARKRDRGD